MTDSELLTVLKVDLQISSGALDEYLTGLIEAAKEYIATEGIALTDSVGDCQLVVMYAAYLYRRRREENVTMPRMLRWAMNNRLFEQKAGSTDG